MLPWKLRKRHILPASQNLLSVYFSLAKFQLVSCNLSLAMIWQRTYTHELPKLCSATLTVFLFTTFLSSHRHSHLLRISAKNHERDSSGSLSSYLTMSFGPRNLLKESRESQCLVFENIVVKTRLCAGQKTLGWPIQLLMTLLYHPFFL